MPEQTQEPIEEFKRGTFARVECADCGNEQILYNRASTYVTCQVCGSSLAEPTGGIVDLQGTFIEYVDRSLE